MGYNYKRTKKDALDLARVAEFMNNYLREENQKIEKEYLALEKANKWLVKEKTRQKQTITDLRNQNAMIQQGWEDLANALHEINRENDQLRAMNRRLTEQLLDTEDTESDPEWFQELPSRGEQREMEYEMIDL